VIVGHRGDDETTERRGKGLMGGKKGVGTDTCHLEEEEGEG